MSPERNDPRATWQHPNDLELSWAEPDDEPMPPLSYRQDDVALSVSNPPGFAEDDEEEEITDTLKQPEPFLTRSEAMRHLGQQFSPILAPLLFGGLTFLFILLLVQTNRAYLHAERLWPIGLVLLALAVLQGMMLYYAGSNNLYWTLGIVGGFFLFVLTGCFAIFGPIATLIFLIVLIIISIIAVRFYMRPVPEGSVDIVYAFGKYSRTLFPGLNFVLPWEWVDEVRLDTRERQWVCPEQTVPVSPTEDVHFKAAISYQLLPEDASLAVLQIDNWEEHLQEIFKALLQSMTPHLKPQDFIPWPQSSHTLQSGGPQINHPDQEHETRWDHINNMLFQRVQDKVASWGVVIHWVQVRDITLTPRSLQSQITTQLLQHEPVPDARAAQAAATVGMQRPEPLATPPPAPVHPVPPPAPIGNPIAMQPAADGAAPTAPAPQKRPKEETLTNMYKQIQNGHITSPEAIRRVAAGFQAIANDPEYNKKVSFDAAQAARTLYARAQFFEDQERQLEEQAKAAAGFNDDVTYNEGIPTSPAWSNYRPPSDDDFTAGG